jgi:hypothetical protein
MFDLLWIKLITSCIKKLIKGRTYDHASDHISLIASRNQLNNQQLLRQLDEENENVKHKIETLEYIYYEYVPYFEIIIKKKFLDYCKNLDCVYARI